MGTTKNKNFFVFVFIGAIALSFLLYGNSIGGDFVYDDHFFADRPELSSPGWLLKVWTEPYLPQSVAAGLYRPLAVFSFALNFIIFGKSTLSFHIVNILLNGAVVFLVFLLVLKLFKNKLLALFSALFFAFLPIHTESVAFIKSRDEILAALFALWSWILFISAAETGNKIDFKKIIISCAMFLLAVFSKELIIILPLLFLFVFWVRVKPSLTRLAALAAPFAVAGLIYLGLRYKVLGSYAFGKDNMLFAVNPVGFADFPTRIFTAFKIAFTYIGKTFVPWNLSATYHYDQLTLVSNIFMSWQALAGLGLLAALIFTISRRELRNTPFGIGAAAFFVPYLVISKFVFKSGDILAERWMYFPSVGLSIIGGYALFLIYEKRKKLGIAIIAAVLTAYALIMIPRNLVWASDEVLFKNMVKTAPRSVQGYANLANFYMKNDLLGEARQAAEAGFNIYPDYSPLLNVIGAIAFKDNNYDLAKTAFLKAIELNPEIPLAYSNLGRLYYGAGEYDKASEILARGIGLYSIRPKPTDIFLYALSLVQTKRYNDSVNVVNKYFFNETNNSQVRFILALNYFKMGNIAEAKKYFDWNPNKTEAEKIKILKAF